MVGAISGVRRSAYVAVLMVGLGMSLEVTPAGTSDSDPTTYGGRLDRDAFAHPLANLDATRALDFRVGAGLFKRVWVTAPASTQAADGLGPLYNARSCHSCHPRNGRGLPPVDGMDTAALVMRVDIPAQDERQGWLLAQGLVANIPEPTYGRQLQSTAIAGHRAEYRLLARYNEVTVELADGMQISLRHPEHRITALAYGSLHPQARLSPRIAPPLIGLGLLEAIPTADILAQADPGDADGDGISGRPNWVWSHESGGMALGRFGHKAGVATLTEQSQQAFFSDIGISVPLFPQGAGDCTAVQTDCLAAPTGNTPRYANLEADGRVVNLVADYIGRLAVPVRRKVQDLNVVAGERLFAAIGCPKCHTPHQITRRDDGSTHAISPYSDLLVHDMGEGLADNRPEGRADGREWRTPPLWGIGLTALVGGGEAYLHDGRARNLIEAILWHGGEAQAQRDAVAALGSRERNHLLRFLGSI